VDLVRDIALRGYIDVFNLVSSRALIYTFPRTSFTDPAAHRSAHQIFGSLVERTIIISESALGLIKKTDDRHARLAIKILMSDPTVFQKVATYGNERGLKFAIQKWALSDSDFRRILVKHHRNKTVAHRAIPDSDMRVPDVGEIHAITGRVADLLAFLVTGAGVRADTRALHSDVAHKSAFAFWKAWQ
jgi:hypothetical protein